MRRPGLKTDVLTLHINNFPGMGMKEKTGVAFALFLSSFGIQAANQKLTLMCDYEKWSERHNVIIDIDFDSSTIIYVDRFKYTTSGIHDGNTVRRITEMTPRSIEFMDEHKGRPEHIMRIDRMTGEYIYKNNSMGDDPSPGKGICRKAEGPKF